MRMMHLRRYQGVADDGSTINGTGLSKVGFVLFCVWLFVFIFCFYRVVIKVRYYEYKIFNTKLLIVKNTLIKQPFFMSNLFVC